MQIWDEKDYYETSTRGRVACYKRNGSLMCPSPLLLIDTLSRKSFSYDKLPEEPLCLTILKLDTTSFEIQVSKNGTVAELKQAVEAAFHHLPRRGRAWKGFMDRRFQ